MSTPDDIPRRNAPVVSTTWSEAARRVINPSPQKAMFSRCAKRAVLLCLSQAPPQHPSLTKQWPQRQSNATVDITFVSDEEMTVLNGQHRAKPRPTDVLSFALWEGEMEWPQDEEYSGFMLGDIIIAVETTVQQAQEHGHTAADEAGFLAAHGALHLLGYDHIDNSSRRLMWKWQNQVLDQLKNPRRKRSASLS